MKINSILIGKGKGSAGNVTVTQLKGQTILKQKASIVANPRTPEQVAQRKVINRAVYVWQLIGNVIKSGWTSLKPFCSQYNTFTSENAQFFKNATFTKENFQAMNLLGSKATKGKLGVLNHTISDVSAGAMTLDFEKVNLNQIAKVGDKIHVLAGDGLSSELGYDSKIVTQPILDAATASLDFEVGEAVHTSTPIYACWLTTADGKGSTTQNFMQA